MGLDMYLNRRKYIGNKWKKPEEQATIIAKDVDQAKVSEVVEEVGYWRKANAIHKWFVDHVQNGNDDCKEYHVTNEQIKELLDAVTTVLVTAKLVKGKVCNGYTFKDGKEIPMLEDGMVIQDPIVAQTVLPTTKGFFFGGTDYDEYYVEDLKETKKILEDAVKNETADYYYQSSW